MISENINLATCNTFHIDVNARYFCDVASDDELIDALSFARARDIEVIVLGGGSNIIFTQSFDGLVLRPAYKGVKISGETITIGAGENWHAMVRYCLEQGLSGIENLSLIPGSCGAAPIQNIGAYGQEFADVFIGLQGFHRHTGEKLKMNKEDCIFAYRDSVFKQQLKEKIIISEITLKLSKEYMPVVGYQGIEAILTENDISSPTAMDVSDAVMALRKRKLPDPVEQGNAGSFFKNPIISLELLETFGKDWPNMPSHRGQDGLYKIPAAWLIENSGMKGHRIGDASVSLQHALVIVNEGNATGIDVLALRDEIQSRVEREFGLVLEVEPTFY